MLEDLRVSCHGLGLQGLMQAPPPAHACTRAMLLSAGLRFSSATLGEL